MDDPTQIHNDYVESPSVGNDMRIINENAVRLAPEFYQHQQQRDDKARDPLQRIEMAKQRRETRPDEQIYDEVRITTEPRFKMSHASGSEWRISARTQLLLKGVVIREDLSSSVSSALDRLPLLRYGAEEVCTFDAQQVTKNRYREATESVCDQEGCREPAETWFKIVKQTCDKCGHAEDIYTDRYRGFCGRHVERGTQSYGDSDECYRYFAGVPVDRAKRARRIEDTSHSGSVLI